MPGQDGDKLDILIQVILSMTALPIQHWTKLNVSKAKPPTRSHHTTSCIAGPLTGQEHPVLMVVGGYGVGKGDVWMLDVDKGVWSEVSICCRWLV